ncbi:MAG: hypothetical protein HXX10_12420 [Rhodoplanes sp.]|uniref:protealysin inhibitor emfourin n=1 Tax=Rhodoplanes sp. TaxID=1968906 RepID=UPI0017E53938|nr:protealysin inhibitor emfourin [Rhodoplanes sp.]NVO14831.1 hypothetical protein [Rhodoplanes sp.]
MKVTVVVRGGQMGAFASRLPSQVVDAAALPPAQAAELRRLVEAARQVPTRTLSPGAVPGDVQSIAVTVEDGGAPFTMRASDATMSSAFSALVDWLRRRTGP